MASTFEVRSLPESFTFLMKSLVAWRQVQQAPGAIGAALIAHPFKRTFFTLSAWTDRKALYTYAGTEPHKSVMLAMREVCQDSTFTFWTAPVDGPVSWAEAKQRLTAEALAKTEKAAQAASAPESPGALSAGMASPRGGLAIRHYQGRPPVTPGPHSPPASPETHRSGTRSSRALTRAPGNCAGRNRTGKPSVYRGNSGLRG
jgi:hypothetical protein